MYTLDEIRNENTDQELIRRINQLEENVLTSKLLFPVEKQRSVKLHAHVEPNETDTKIDDQLRQNDSKDLVVYRKFAKIGIRCSVQIKTKDVKKVLVSFEMFSPLITVRFYLERICYRTSCSWYFIDC